MRTILQHCVWSCLIIVAAGYHLAEIDAIEEALNNKMDKGPWLDLFVSSSIMHYFSNIANDIIERLKLAQN